MAAKHASGMTARAKTHRRWTVVLVVSLVVFVGSLIALGLIGYSYWQGQRAYDRVADVASVRAGSAEIGNGANASDQSFDLASVTVDWKALAAINPDIIAWIYVPNTPINYPVVRGSDDEYYLHHDFERAQSSFTENGCIFMKASNAVDFSDAGTFLFGHHLNDGTMFSAIADEATFANARDVYVFTPDRNMKLRAFALVHCAFDDPLVQTSFGSKAEMEAYVSDKMQRSVITTDPTISTAAVNRFIALSTCDNQISDGRYVLFCLIDQIA